MKIEFLFAILLFLSLSNSQTNAPEAGKVQLATNTNIEETAQIQKGQPGMEPTSISAAAAIASKYPESAGNQLRFKEKCRKNNDCQDYQFCSNHVCLDNCSKMKCKAGFKCNQGKCLPLRCKSDTQCRQFFTCVDGVCKDKCSLLGCRYGCVRGSCLQKKCSTSKECGLSQACSNSVCTQICALTTCIVGNQCIHGECFQIKCKKNEDCRLPQTLVCVDGGCTEKCTKESCKTGFKCSTEGKCVESVRACKTRTECGVGEKCQRRICVNGCLGVNCKKGQICVNGKCKSQQCGGSICPSNTYCQQNSCKANINVCTDEPDYTVTVCTDPRPTFQNCPLPSFAPPGPPPSYCGVTADGQRVNFLYLECTVCQSEEIVYYFNKPCYNAPFTCSSSQTCQGYYCSTPGCTSDTQCPYNWQACIQGKCLDSCNLKKCANCKFGECLYQPNPKGSCQYLEGPMSGGECAANPNLTCHGFSCTDDCERQACIPSQNCQHGYCIPE